MATVRSRQRSTAQQQKVAAKVRTHRERTEARETARLAKALGEYFRKMAGRAENRLGRFLDGKVTKDADFPIPSLANLVEEVPLYNIINKTYMSIGDSVYNQTNELLGLTQSFDLNSRAIKKDVLDQIGESVKNISLETRSTLRSIVKTGIDNGSSPASIAKSLIESIQGWGGGPKGTQVAHSRAMVIARTETAHAYNLAAIQSYKDSGLVKVVLCLDSPDCGWIGHNSPELANGTERTFEEARAHPTSHPNCVRAFAPVVKGGPVSALGQQPAKPAAPPKFDPLDPKRYQNPVDNDAFSNRQVDKWGDSWMKNPITGSGKRAATSYSGNGFEDMNNYLRFGPDSLYSERVRRVAEENIGALEKAISRNTLPNATVLRRGASGRSYGLQGPEDAQKLLGQTITEPGFMSTSATRGYGLKEVQLVLTAPEGHPALYMNSVSRAHELELEVLLKPGTRYIVDKVEDVGQDVVRLTGRILAEET